MKTRQEIVIALRTLWGSGVEVEQVIDYLEDAWETHDLLARLFGADYACQAINATARIGSCQMEVDDVDESIFN